MKNGNLRAAWAVAEQYKGECVMKASGVLTQNPSAQAAEVVALLEALN